jgi:riboflavin transporter FmnP
MNTKTLALTIVFAAVTVALNPAITGMAVPAPYAPFLFYQIWEIPIVVAFLLIGPKYGAAISVLNTAVLLALFPGASPTGPFYNFVAGLSMLLGIYLAYKLVTSRQKTDNFTFRYGTKAIAFSAVLGIVLRVGIMSITTYALLRYPPPVGYAMSEATVIYWVPFIAFFNFTLALYTIPLGFLIAKVVSSNLKLQNQS